MADKKVLKKLTDAIEGEIVFMPAPTMRRTKAAFWASFNENPICDKDQITLALALQLTGETKLKNWWKDPEFNKWFINAEEQRQRLEYLFDLALDAAEDILLDSESNANARVSMVKVIAELTNKVPQKWKQIKYLDESVQNMDKKQLEDFLRKNGMVPKLVGGLDGEED